MLGFYATSRGESPRLAAVRLLMIGLLVATLLQTAPLPPASALVIAQNKPPKDGGAQRPPPKKKKRRDDGDRREEDAVRFPPLSTWTAPR